MKRCEVYWADLVPRCRGIAIVVPISSSASQGKPGITAVEIPGGVAGFPKTSFAVCHQVTTLDRAKLTKRVGSLPPELLEFVEEGLRAALDLD